MTNSLSQNQAAATNGASLEDCHTNFFAITDLCGIKWSRYTPLDPVIQAADIGEDPVLAAYSRCLDSDVLCVWRRAPGAARAPLLEQKKELWIFWYGELPDISGIVGLDLNEDEQGSWDNGMIYECRSLLFKALHNRIERYLLSRGFVRLGKWLVQPRSPLAPLNQVLGFHLSTTFSFFVHGESTVCVSVEVRKHPPVYWLTPSIISAMKGYGRTIPVILAPFGLAGTLEGEIVPTSVDDDRDTKKLWDEWNKYYPVEALNAYRCCSMPSLTGCTCASGNCGTCACCDRAPTRDSSIFGTPPKSEAPQVCSCVEARRKGPSLPNMVSVIAGRTRFKYPSAYVLVVDEKDDGEALQIGKDVAERRSRDKRFVPSEFRPPRRRPKNRPFGNRQSRRIPKFRNLVGLESAVLSECTLPNDEVFAVTPDSSMPVDEDTKDDSGDIVGRWDFTDSMCSGCKIPCSCVSTKNDSNSHVIPLRPLNVNAPDSFKKRWSSLRPFHRRFYGDMLQQLDDVIRVCNQRHRSSKQPLNRNCDTKPNVTQIQTTSPSYSVGPSPMPTPHSMMSQPDSVPDPAAAANANNLPGADQQNCFTASSFPNQQQPPSCGESRETADGGFKSVKYENPGSTLDANADLSDLMNSQLASGNANPTSEAGKPSTWRPELTSKADEQPEPGPLVRPKLEISSHELIVMMDREESSRTKCLYDFSDIEAWSNYPIAENPPKDAFRIENANPFASMLEMDDAMMGPASGSNVSANTNLEAARKLLSSDPYEFDENPGSNGSPLLDSLRKKEDAVVKEENVMGQFAPNQAPTNLPSFAPPKSERSMTDCQLFSSKDLVAHMEDLNEIFEEEDREADMDAAMAEVPTPPGSNKPEDEKSQKPWSSLTGGASGCTPGMFLGHAELANMFPTPPSHEPLQPMQSPCPEASGSYGLPVNMSSSASSSQANSNECDLSLVKVEREEDEGYVGGMDTFDSQMSPETAPDANNPFRRFMNDLSPIFEPYPSICYVGSSKYSPLTTMPSQINPLPAIVHTLIYRPSTSSSDSSGGNNANNSNSGRGGANGPETPSDVKPSPLPVLPSPADELSQPMDQSSSQSNLTSALPVPFESHQTGNSLIANLILADSAMNVFRDHNFESCNLCVCSEVPNSVGNIKGLDGQLYLPERGLRHLTRDFGEMEVSRCSCGFSAVVNRRKAYKAGLFYEDECEITGIRTDKPLYCCPPVCLSSWLSSKSSVEIKETLSDVPDVIFSILTTQWNTIGGTSLTLLGKASLLRRWRCEGPNCPQKDPQVQNLLEYWDSVEITTNALDFSVPGRRKVEPADIDVDSDIDVTRSGLHLWSFMHATSNASSKEVIQALRILQPLLQEALQKKKTPGTRDATYQVLGPLTWRQFHRMAGRGTEDQCEPQPIPYLVVGHDKDWISVSPLAISVWENLLLEPYGRRRDIAYIVVAPDDNYVLPRVLSFFKELSSTYETCRLGRHSPVTKKLRDGIIGVGRKEATKLLNEPVDDWFSSLGDSPLARHLRLYAQVCRHYVGPYLAQQTLDTILQDEKEVKVKPPVESINVAQRPVSPSSMPPPPTPDGTSSDMKPPTPKPNLGEEGKDDKSCDDPTAGHGLLSEPDETDDQPPALVVYLIDPFTYASQEPELYRLASLALLRCFNEIKKALPENKHDICDNLYLQIVPLESVVDFTEGSVKGYKCDDASYPQASAHWTRPSAAPAALKNFAFSVFSQVRTVLNHTMTVKSLTGFGPAAGADTFLKTLAKEGKSNGYQILNPAYILAPVKDSRRSTGDSLMSNVPGKTAMQSPVLYLTYCLSEDQKWLLACATDEKGELMDSTVINVHVPNRSQRRKFVARKLGLEKLMNFALGCISGSIGQWRLVVGRLGRIGHSELKSWASLLSKKSLVRWAKRLREMCKQCNCLPPASTDATGIASACLVSLEPDSTHRVLADQFTPDERFGQATAASTLSTPQDISCTHILVFPTSAVTRSSQVTFHDQHINPMDEDFGDDDFFNQLNEDGMENFAELLELEGFDPSVGDMLGGGNGPGSPSSGSPKGLSFENNDGSDFGVSMGFGMNGLGSSQADSRNAMDSHQQKSPRVHSLMTEAGEEVGVVLQQPLALGYMVSTAPPGLLPNWFWSQCPHMKEETPTFLTAALHLHTYVDPSSQSGQQTDDFSLVQNQNSSQPPRQHPLDSDKTTDVLRYVLEGYNSLSWLAIDPARNDRRSCLPIHMQVLANMYNTMAALV